MKGEIQQYVSIKIAFYSMFRISKIRPQFGIIVVNFILGAGVKKQGRSMGVDQKQLQKNIHMKGSFLKVKDMGVEF